MNQPKIKVIKKRKKLKEVLEEKKKKPYKKKISCEHCDQVFIRPS
jgi:hypothetical protein